MADTIAATGLTVQQWDDQFFTEFLTENRFAGEMGTSENSIIQVKEDLTKKQGDSITYALVNRLTNDAVTGTNVLEGNEEDMTSRSFRLYVDKRRNGVRIAEMNEQKSAISLRTAARSVLKDWAMQDMETQIIQAFGSINGTNYASASEADKDAWLVDNVLRVYDPSGTYGTDHSAMLAQLDTTADLLTAADVSAMKYRALTVANPKIRPIRSAENGRYYYVLYCHPAAFRDLKNEANSPIIAAQRETVKEMENNRLFQGGDLLWDGVIIKEIPRMYDLLTFTDVGASSAEVVPCFLTGAQAIGYGVAKRWTSQTQEFDYGDKYGVATESIYGVKKMIFGSGAGDTDDTRDHGVMTGYFATVL